MWSSHTRANQGFGIVFPKTQLSNGAIVRLWDFDEFRYIWVRWDDICFIRKCVCTWELAFARVRMSVCACLYVCNNFFGTIIRDWKKISIKFIFSRYIKFATWYITLRPSASIRRESSRNPANDFFSFLPLTYQGRFAVMVPARAAITWNSGLWGNAK